MDEERLQADEYEKQYYGFSSTELYEDFKGQVFMYIKLALEQLETELKEQVADETYLKQTIVEIFTTFVEKAKAPLQKFKEEARKIFAIPKNVILDEDKYNINQYSDDDILQLKKEVAELERELIREQVFLAKCKQQKEVMDTVIKPLYEKVNCINRILKHLPENSEIEKNYKKVSDVHEQYIQYYFNNENVGTENPDILSVERNFCKITDNFFESVL